MVLRRLLKTSPGLVLILTILSGVAGCRPVRMDLKVDRMSVGLDVRENGDLVVTEQFDIRVWSDKAVEFERHVPARRYDRVSDIAATVDGAAVTEGQGLNHITTGRGVALDITWTLPPGDGVTHVLTLTYTAHNVVELSGIRGTLDWRVLRTRRDFDVNHATVMVTLPDGAVFLQDPWMDEAGWAVTRQPHGFTATIDFVPFNESATTGAEFTIDRMSPSKPQWQSDREFLDEFVPAFIAAALFILVTGAGILVMLRVKHPPVRVRPASGEETEPEPEPEVAPALRIAVMRGRPRGDRTELTAAVSSLVARDLVELDQDTVIATENDQEVWAHEEAVLSALPRAGGTPVDLPAAFRRVNRPAYRRAALEDLVSAGLADRDRVNALRDLFRASLAIIVFGAVVWAAVALTIPQFGVWPLVVPWSILGVGLAFAAVSMRYGVLTDLGARVRMLYFARVRDGRNPE